MGPWVGATEGDLNTESGAISPDREIMPPEYGSDRRRCQPCSRGTVMDLPWAILGPRRPAGWPTDQPSRRCRSDRNMVLGPRRPASPGVAITRKAGRESVTVRDKGSGNASAISADMRRYGVASRCIWNRADQSLGRGRGIDDPRTQADFRASDAARHSRSPGWWLLPGQPGRRFQPCAQGCRSRARTCARTCAGPARIG